jgi:hypothetical protein
MEVKLGVKNGKVVSITENKKQLRVKRPRDLEEVIRDCGKAAERDPLGLKISLHNA